MVHHVFLLGSEQIGIRNSITDNVVDFLTSYRQDASIIYHISQLSKAHRVSDCENILYFNISPSHSGAFKYIIYDIKSLFKTLNYIKKNNLKNCTIVLFSMRSGIFLPFFKNEFKKLGSFLYIFCENDVFFSKSYFLPLKMYYKLCEQFCVRLSDLLICNFKDTENKFKNNYSKYSPAIIKIHYDTNLDDILNPKRNIKFYNWLYRYNITPNNYYLLIDEFTLTSNITYAIEEFMRSTTQKKLVVLSTKKNNNFYKILILKTQFYKDKRIEFFELSNYKNLISQMQLNSYACISPNLVGCNPEYMKLNLSNLKLLLNTPDNKANYKDNVLYFENKPNSLTELINSSELVINQYFTKNKKNTSDDLSETSINQSIIKFVKSYENIFTCNKPSMSDS